MKITDVVYIISALGLLVTLHGLMYDDMAHCDWQWAGEAFLFMVVPAAVLKNNYTIVFYKLAHGLSKSSSLQI